MPKISNSFKREQSFFGTYTRRPCKFYYLVGAITAHYPAGIYLFKVNNLNNKTMREICSKLTMKTAGETRFKLVFWCLPR